MSRIKIADLQPQSATVTGKELTAIRGGGRYRIVDPELTQLEGKLAP